MNIKLTDKGVCAIAKKIMSWKPLRPHLGLTEKDEEAIISDYRKYEEQKKALLYRWREKMGECATPRNFVAAALEAEEKELADDIGKLPFDEFLIQPVDQINDGITGVKHHKTEVMMIVAI